MTTVRIMRHNGVRHAKLVSRTGDFAITIEGEFLPVVTHLPTGLAVRDSIDLTSDQRARLLEMLAVLPRWDLQTFDQELVAGLVEAVKREVAGD